MEWGVRGTETTPEIGLLLVGVIPYMMLAHPLASLHMSVAAQAE
jgi:hypothetical protein